MEKKDYNDNYSRVRHSNDEEQDNAFLLCVSTHAGHIYAAELSVGERKSSATEKISPASSLYENRKLPVRQTGVPPLKGSVFVRTESRRIGQSGRCKPAIRSGNAEFGTSSSW